MLSKRLLGIFCIFTLFGVLLIGCSNEKGDSHEEVDDESKEVVVEEFTIDEPVTLRMINWWPEEVWLKQWKEPVEKKFPNVTLEQIAIQPESSELEELYASQLTPDLFMGHFDHLNTLIEYETAFDMRDLISKRGLDTEKFLPGLMNQIETVSSDGEVYMLPFLVDRYVLHYNKDIFDKFGVFYPTDDMSYEEVLELARKVTGKRDGVDYYGLQWQWDSFNSVGAHLKVLDNETLEPQFTSDKQWNDFFSLIQNMHDIPGNLPEEEVYKSYVWDRFVGEQNVAMVPLWYYPGLMDTELNWDMVTYPSWDGFDDQVPGGVGFGIGVTSLSEHKDEAFHVLQYLLSEEAVTDRFYNEGFNVNQLVYDPNELEVEWDSGLEKINIDALFKKGFISLKRHPFERQVFADTVIEQMGDMLYSNTDVNTHLRVLTERANIKVEDLETK